jgi:hypothetical protein
MTTPVRRVCQGCNRDQTPLERGLESVRNARGISIGLYCATCVPIAREAVESVNRQHGLVRDAKGQQLCGPRGTPSDPAVYRAAFQPAR